MTARRLVLVARRYWPLADDASVVAMRLAAAFQSRGWPTTVLTCRWLRHWPDEFDHNGVRVVRLHRAPGGWFGGSGYRHRLRQWLAEHRQEYDAALVLGLLHDADTVVSSGDRWQFPVALRTLSAGPEGDCHRQLHEAGGGRKRRTCAHATGIVGPTALAERELIASGYPRDRIRLIPPGIALPEERIGPVQRLAQQSLASANAELVVSERAWVALHVVRSHQLDATRWLLEIWRHVIERAPNSRLWLAGDMALQEKARSWAHELGVLGPAVNVGLFDDEDDLYLAADALIEPGLSYESPLAVYRAMAAGLPVVAAVDGQHDSIIVDGRTGRRLPPRHLETLATAIEQLQSHTAWAAELGRAARAFIEQDYGIDAEVNAYAQLFDSTP